MTDDDRPFVIESPTRIRLMPVAKAWAREFGLSEAQMARHLLQQNQLRDAGLSQGEGES
jgi:hypothetical protein